VLGGIRARDVMFNALTLNPATDVSLSAEYQIIPRLSAFMQVNNLLNNKYQRWYGYEVYGFNIYGGLRLKF
jgi:outer membrane receptor protein involved in Fe transport